MKATPFTLAVVACAFPAHAGQITITDTFDDGTNPHNWTWASNPALANVQPTGGNPDGWLRTLNFVGNAGGWTVEHPDYTGNFAQRQVTSLGADFFSIQGDPNNELLSILLINEGNPANFNDDTYAGFISNVPSPDFPQDGWVSHDFAIPSDAISTPAGWEMASGAIGQLPPILTWPELMADVDRVLLTYGDPLGIVLLFDVTRGMDNARITTIPAPGSALLSAACLVAMTYRRRSSM